MFWYFAPVDNPNVAPKESWSNKYSATMIGENRQLVTDEPVEFEE